MESKQDIRGYIKEHGIKPSYQRMKILEYLMKNKTHPTVDTIYRALVDDIPTLSKTTVYNTMGLFMDHKIVQMVTIEDNEVRYDADMTDHGHFKCMKCMNIYDFEINLKDTEIKGIEMFKVEEKHIYFKGICGMCGSGGEKQ